MNDHAVALAGDSGQICHANIAISDDDTLNVTILSATNLVIPGFNNDSNYVDAEGGESRTLCSGAGKQRKIPLLLVV